MEEVTSSPEPMVTLLDKCTASQLVSAITLAGRFTRYKKGFQFATGKDNSSDRLRLTQGPHSQVGLFCGLKT